MASIGDRIRIARKAKGLSQAQLAEAVGVEQSSVAGWESDANGPARTRLPRIAQALESSVEWLTTGAGDAPSLRHRKPDPAPAAPVAATVDPDDLPVYGTAEGGPDGMIVQYEAIEFRPRPAPLIGVPGAFGLYVVGESMLPRYEPGDLLLIHPTKPPRRGDYVLVVKASSDHEHSAMVKRFERWTEDALEVEQLNPHARIRIPRGELHGVHRIVGQYEGR
ncbi:MAG: XRE family transcriptional regulator [Alphaproteobacteria bacterium]